MERYTFAIYIAFLLFCGKITASEAFDTSTLDNFRLGDEITNDLLDEIRAFQAILNQPISLGVLVKGGRGLPGTPGPPGKTGGKGTMGDQGPVGENASPGHAGRFGKTGTLSPPGEPGAPGFNKIYDSVNYANEKRDVNYVNSDRSNTNMDQTNYNTDQSFSEVNYA